MSEFWDDVGKNAGDHTGDETERLFKNLQTEYQRVRQWLHVSGIGTDEPPTLRSSSDLFNLSQAYHQLFFPHGGSTVPHVVMTENSTTFLNRYVNLIY